MSQNVNINLDEISQATLIKALSKLMSLPANEKTPPSSPLSGISNLTQLLINDTKDGHFKFIDTSIYHFSIINFNTVNLSFYFCDRFVIVYFCDRLL